MSVDQPSKWSTQSSSGSASVELPQYSFVQQSDNIGASKTRRAVRSHAMKAVRRQQRQEKVKTFQPVWPEEQSSNKEYQLAKPEIQLSELGERQSQSQHQRQSSTQEERAFGSLPSPESQEPTRNLEEYELPIYSPPGLPSTRVYPRSEWVEPLPFVGRSASSRTLSSKAEEEIFPNGMIIRELLGAGRVDPFQTFPVRADRSMSKLMDHCMLSTANHLPLCTLILLTNPRHHCHASDILRHTISQANPYRPVPHRHKSPGISTCDGCVCIQEPRLSALLGYITTHA